MTEHYTRHQYALSEFASKWQQCEVEVVGMVDYPDGGSGAAESEGATPTSWDCIVVGRTHGKDRFDIYEVVEGASYQYATSAAKWAARLLLNDTTEWSER